MLPEVPQLDASSGDAGEVSDDIIFRLGIVDGPFAMVGGVIAGLVYLGYRIDKAAHAEIQARLKKRAALSLSGS